jgi:hypothetical protein
MRRIINAGEFKRTQAARAAIPVPAVPAVAPPPHSREVIDVDARRRTTALESVVLTSGQIYAMSRGLARP